MSAIKLVAPFLAAMIFVGYSAPAAARYIESDPIGQAAGPSTYSYVSGNPLRHRDPLGLADFFFGGFFDGSGIPIVQPATNIVRDYERGFADQNSTVPVEYFEHDQYDQALAAIRAIHRINPCETINLIGHSLGGDTAALLSQELAAEGIGVDNLITIDPVGAGFAPNAGNWIDVNSAPNGHDSSDSIANWGGKWGSGPQGIANSYYTAPFHHGSFPGMMGYTPNGGSSAADVLKGLPRTRKGCGCGN